jgi:hypothetical protein
MSQNMGKVQYCIVHSRHQYAARMHVAAAALSSQQQEALSAAGGVR